MPWLEVSAVSLRKEFAMLASSEGAVMRALCRHYGISPRTGYKWLDRFRREGAAGLAERSRRPRGSPSQTPPAVERAVLEVRDQHPAWGGRKIRRWLLDRGQPRPPSPSTVTAILRRHGQLDPHEGLKHRPYQRFEHPAPNALWQMDFKGHFPVEKGRCHPLTLLDDHSRFALALEACPNEQGATVRERLVTVFRRYGLPERLLVDNGPPWGNDWEHPYTPLTVWLARLGISVVHGRPYHPQTQGKDERFHRSLKAEVLQGRTFADLPACQAAFDRWRHVYNLERPHEALALAIPASRYQPSPRPYPDVLPPLAYGPSDALRKVQAKGEFSFHGRIFVVGKAFCGQLVALRPTNDDALWNVFFHTHPITQIDLCNPTQP